MGLIFNRRTAEQIIAERDTEDRKQRIRDETMMRWRDRWLMVEDLEKKEWAEDRLKTLKEKRAVLGYDNSPENERIRKFIKEHDDTVYAVYHRIRKEKLYGPDFDEWDDLLWGEKWRRFFGEAFATPLAGFVGRAIALTWAGVFIAIGFHLANKFLL